MSLKMTDFSLYLALYPGLTTLDTESYICRWQPNEKKKWDLDTNPD